MELVRVGLLREDRGAVVVAEGQLDLFALLGTTRRRARVEGLEAAAAYEGIDLGLTAMLIDALRASEQRPRFVYLSSLGARPDSGNAYLDARWRTEERLRESGLPCAIAPSFVTHRWLEVAW